MNKELRIRVYMTEYCEKPHLERFVKVDDSISVPYESMISNFRFLFGSKCVVVFNFC